MMEITWQQPMPSASAGDIASISRDHTEFLGETIGQIAFEKAGIFKRSAPAIIGYQSDAALKVLEAQAHRCAAKSIVAGQDFHVSVENGRLVFEDERGLLDLPLPPFNQLLLALHANVQLLIGQGLKFLHCCFSLSPAHTASCTFCSNHWMQ